LIDHPDHHVKRRGRDLMRPTRELFRHWARCRDGKITRAGLLRLVRPIRREIDSLLLRGEFSANAKLIGMCTPLYDHRDWLWTFLDVQGIEPMNNVSERAVRLAVIRRKLSLGTQSVKRSRFVKTILTVVETCRRQSRNSFECRTAAIQAHFAVQPTPSLLARLRTVALQRFVSDTIKNAIFYSLPGSHNASDTRKQTAANNRYHIAFSNSPSLLVRMSSP
jgi:hypothetical protein